MFPSGTSNWAVAGLVVLFVALAVQSTGYGTNYWMVRKSARSVENYGIGLWKMTNCSGSYNTPCSKNDYPGSFSTVYFKVVIAFETCALVCMVVALVCMFFYVGSVRSRTRCMAVAVMVLVYFAAACGITGMVLLIRHMPSLHYPGWSSGLSVIATILNIMTGVLLIPDVRRYDYQDKLLIHAEYEDLPNPNIDQPPPSKDKMYDDEVKAIVEPQGPLAAPRFQFLNRDKKRKVDGF